MPDELIGLPDLPLGALSEAIPITRDGDAQPELAVSVHEFASEEEDDPIPLLGTVGQNVIPAAGLTIIGGKPGIGKTTVALDLAFALASGLPWPRIDAEASSAVTPLACPNALKILLIENEGPRALFRHKIRDKLAAWQHEIKGEIWIQTWQWGSFSFERPDAVRLAAGFLDQHEIDLVIGDPLKSLGAVGRGAPEETRAFALMLGQMGLWEKRSFLFLHHFRKEPAEDDIDQLSGSWGGDLDSLMVLRATTHDDQLRLSFPKLRWATEERLPMILGKLRNALSFEYLGDEGSERMLEHAIADLLKDGKPRTTAEIANKEEGIGARKARVKETLETNPQMFRSVPGPEVGRSPRAICWLLIPDGGTSGTSGLVREDEGNWSTGPPPVRGDQLVDQLTSRDLELDWSGTSSNGPAEDEPKRDDDLDL